MDFKDFIKKKEKAYQSGDNEKIAETLINFAEFCMSKGKFEKAIEEYKEASLINKNKNNIQYGCINRMIGECYLQLSDFQNALYYENIHYEIAKAEKDLKEEQRALTCIGRIYFCWAVEDPDNINYIILDKSIENIPDVERIDMKVRLLLNFGIIEEYKDNFKNAIEFMKQGLNLCKDNDQLYDQLQLILHNMGSLYYKIKDHRTSLEYFDKALRIAEKLSNDKIIKISNTLTCKFEVYIDLGDFNNAKQVIYKAYKLKCPNEIEFNQISQNLKITIVLCQTQKSILKTSDSDYDSLKKFYEQMGDALCELKNYRMAIEYYKKMLHYSQMNNDNQKSLSAAYVSLALTYKDYKEYDLAIEYFNKELEIHKENVKEQINSYLNIMEILYLKKESLDIVNDYYNQALIKLTNLNNHDDYNKDKIKLMKIYLKILSENKQDNSDLINSINLQLNDLNYLSDSESENESVPETSVYDNIRISECSELSDESDHNNDNERQTRKKRTHLKRASLKINNKGETKLHVASIKGDKKLVEELLKLNYPTNVPDNNGWLPIHEACNHGYIDIVKLLVQYGSPLNITACEGITPLHDAAGNGHLDVVQFLIEHGASTIAKDNNGNTPLDSLLKWKASLDSDDYDLDKFNSIVEKLEKDNQKANVNVLTKTSPSTSRAFVKEYSQSKSTQGSKNSKQVSQRKSLYSDDEIDLEILPKIVDDFNLDKSDGLSMDRQNLSVYRETIKSLRPTNRFKQKKIDSFKKQQKLPALVPEFDLSSEKNWLINDLEDDSNKKRKKLNLISPIKEGSSKRLRIERKRSSSNLRYSPNSKISPRRTSLGENENYLLERNSPNISPFKSPAKKITSPKVNYSNKKNSPRFLKTNSPKSISSSHHLSKLSLSRQKVQTNLMKSGFFRTQDSRNISNCENDNLDLELINSEMNQLNARQISPSQSSKFFTFHVHIENKIWIIPVNLEKIENLTIKWLNDESTKRYQDSEGIKPVLNLETKEGAILNNSDPLESILNFSHVYGNVLEWDTPSLTKRYINLCEVMKEEIDNKIILALEKCEKTIHCLDLNDFNLSKTSMIIVIKSLKHQDLLEKLHLRGNQIDDETVKVFCSILSTLKSLNALDLSLNLISYKSVSYLAESFVAIEQIQLDKLNFSYNNLGDNCIKPLETICNNHQIKELDLSSCDLTCKIFEKNTIIINLLSVEKLNLNGNFSITNLNLNLFLFKFDTNHIRELDLSEINGACVNMNKVAENNINSFSNLENIFFNRCNVTDEDLENFLRLIIDCKKINTISLSYNPKLSLISLRLLLNHSINYKKLIIDGCENILLSENFTKDDTYRWLMTDDLINFNKLNLIQININQQYYINLLNKFWKRIWGSKALIKCCLSTYFEFNCVESFEKLT